MRKLFFSALWMFSAHAFADLHCNFEANSQPGSYLQWDGTTSTVWTLTGWPQQWTEYDNVTMINGNPPYSDQGFTLLAFGDVPLIHIQYSGDYHPGIKYPYVATWGKEPGALVPDGIIGKCWTDDNPPLDANNVQHP